MFFKSIRFRLQLWYGVILVAVLVGFGVTAYQLERGRQFRRVDEELQRRIGVIGNALRQPPRNRPPGERPFGNPPPEGEFPPEERPRPERLPPRESREDFSRRPFEFHLPPAQTALFDATDTNGFYYIIRPRNADDLVRSINAPLAAIYFVKTFPRPAPEMARPPRLSPLEAQPPKTRGQWRELFFAPPSGEIILVGRSIVTEFRELRRTALKLAGMGGVILLLGLAGGWWLASRAIRPIENISATATKISAGDLSQRINVAETDDELGQLAGVLNSTFARLDAAFAQQARFTADAAHELRTPVSVMLTQTQAALARERTAPEYRETIESCQRATQRMRRLIESLLALARLDAGREILPRARFDLTKITRESIHLVAPLADERGIKIESDLAPMEYDGDAEQIFQVITNLLTNAIHYNKENGTVHVTLRQSDDAIQLSVRDTGQGISAEDLPHIFERFYRAEKSRSSGRTGLGLAIAQTIVEKHGGTMDVSSQPGEGAAFIVRLPISPEGRAPQVPNFPLTAEVRL